MKDPIEVGLAEFDIRNEFGQFVLYGGGYGRATKRLGRFDDAVAASIAKALLQRGVRDIAPRLWLDNEVGSE